MRPAVTVVSTGGTIASTREGGAATPSKSGSDLVTDAPEIEDYASLSVREVTQVASFDMDLQTVADIGDVTAEAIEEGADGVVVTHGTDTMEESAYVLDVTREYDAPVVFTGAQRRPDEPSADGPANILTAVRAAAHERLRDAGGVYVAFDEELHAPRDVIKRHTTALDAFVSPEKGPIASFGRRGVRFHRQPRSYSDTIPTTRTDKRVPVLKSGVGIGSRQSDVAIDEDVDGIVIEGTGVGNTTAELCRTAREAIRNDIPVVVASRCPAGTTEAIYGTEGGGQTLAENGAVHAGDLPAHKARLKLALALADTDEPRMAAEYF